MPEGKKSVLVDVETRLKLKAWAGMNGCDGPGDAVRHALDAAIDELDGADLKVFTAILTRCRATADRAEAAE